MWSAKSIYDRNKQIMQLNLTEKVRENTVIAARIKYAVEHLH